MGGPLPKQYIKIGGEPVILRTLRTFSVMDEIDCVFVVADREHIGKMQGHDQRKRYEKGGSRHTGRR